MGELEGKTIAIVGAGGGLGSACAHLCARAGAQLALWDAGCDAGGDGANPQVVQRLASDLRQLGARVHADCSRVEQPGAIPSGLDRAEHALGNIHGLVFAAGLHLQRPLLRTTDAEMETACQVQLLAAMQMCREGAQRMTQHGGGSVVFATGSAPLFGVQRQSVQGAMTAALAGFCRGAALDLKRHNVRVNMLAALARTRLTESLPMFMNIRPDSMTPQQVAQTALFLLSDRSAHVTGEVIGSAGARIYGIRTRETPGHFFDGDFNVDDIAGALPDALKP